MNSVKRTNLWRITFFFLATLFVLFATTTVSATWWGPVVYTVNTTADGTDGACTKSHCSLREAIQASNSRYGGSAIIQFNVGYLNPVVISPASPLPAITRSVLLKTNATNSIDVVLDGSEAGPADGLVLTGSYITVRNLTIQNFNGNGVLVDGSHNMIESAIISGNSGSGIPKNGATSITKSSPVLLDRVYLINLRMLS